LTRPPADDHVRLARPVPRQRSFDMILRRRERKRDAVPRAAPTLKTIDPTSRRSCIFDSLAPNPTVPARVVVSRRLRPGEN